MISALEVVLATGPKVAPITAYWTDKRVSAGQVKGVRVAVWAVHRSGEVQPVDFLLARDLPLRMQMEAALPKLLGDGWVIPDQEWFVVDGGF